MTIDFYSAVTLPNADKLGMVIDYINEHLSSAIAGMESVDDNTPISMWKCNHSLRKEGFFDIDTSIFNVLRETLGINAAMETAVFWRFPKQASVFIHKDAERDQGQVPIKYALTIPLKNCDSLKIRWFEDKDPALTKLTDSPIMTASDPNDFVKVHECYLTQPLIMRLDRWHDAVGENDEPAYLVSIRFDSDSEMINELLTGSP